MCSSDLVERALVEACRRTRAEVVEFTVAPRYAMATEARGQHDWLVEFSVAPVAAEAFVRVLDDTLKQLNTDYRTKRAGDVGMLGPRLLTLPRGTFYEWMRSRSKLGGQNKVPRVVNSRAVADGLLGVAGRVSEAAPAVATS